jgi:hypothetical protein
VLLFARKREQRRQDWLDQNGGPDEHPVAKDNAHGRRASVGVSDKVHRFLAQMLNNTNNKERLVIVCQLVFSGPVLGTSEPPEIRCDHSKPCLK